MKIIAEGKNVGSNSNFNENITWETLQTYGIPVMGILAPGGDPAHPWAILPTGEIGCLTCGVFHDHAIDQWLAHNAKHLKRAGEA